MSAVFKSYNIYQVVHFAALKSVPESVKHPLLYYSNNITGIVNLLQVMIEYDVKKIIFSSSCIVYGDGVDITEDTVTGNTNNPYGKSKFFCEEILKDICKINGTLSALCLRYFNPIGAHPSGLIGES